MSDQSVTEMSPERYKMARRATITSSLGTAMEWIDFTAYGALAATVFPIIFFPAADPTTALIASFATFGVGYGARPLGAIIFGYIGDRWGRKNLLMFTLILMGVVSLIMAVLPTYQQIGIWAPALLVSLRLLQGMALGGEASGAQILTVEHAPRDKRGIYGAYTQIGNPGSQLICNALLAILTAVLSVEQFQSWGWRVPFLVSFALVGIGIYTRVKVAESPAFTHAKEEGATAKRYVLRSHPGTVVRLLLMWGGVTVASLTTTAFAVSYATKNLGMTYNHVFLALMVATGLGIIPLLFGGRISDRIGRRKTVIIGTAALLVAWIPFFPLVSTANIVLVGLGMTLVYGGTQFMVGVLPILFAEPFPTDVRYSGSALAYTGSQLVFGAPAPLIATLLFTSAGVTGVAIFVGACIVLSIAMALITPETRGRDLTEGTPADPASATDGAAVTVESR
ncbi:MFS transporter [Pseudonocardia halophobica]|uniref:MFS transporter n=1 Tax=Pseudonocardia halophobica TaxID=29401 RepID=A0A9W6NVG1_9PSEU|nr:MFS transporter [Pseudonocardia halophobica]GLL10496.1 MFS transporter [Pseudonocardia halophobica]